MIFSYFQVLCEMEYALLQKGIQEHELEKVQRDIVPEDLRNLEHQSSRNLRDWLIYRDYINGLEYVIDAFDHLKMNQEPSEHFNNKRRRRRRRRRHISY